MHIPQVTASSSCAWTLGQALLAPCVMGCSSTRTEACTCNMNILSSKHILCFTYFKPNISTFTLRYSNSLHKTMYSTQDQTVHFTYITSSKAEGKQTHILSSKDITNIGTDTVSYKVLPLGNNVYSMDSISFLICYLSHPSELLAFYF
jgi:hypothetical protein